MSSPDSLAAGQAVWQPRINPWIIAVVVSLAAFMEVLDTSIANVALPHIAGGLAASNDESTWVLTSYLVSNAIVLPISGWLVGMAWKKTVLFDLHCVFHGQFLSVRDRTQSWASSPVSSLARCVWRRLATDGAGHPGR